jgi:hypothetical protein
MAVTAYPGLVDFELQPRPDELRSHLEYLERRIGHLEGVIAPLRARIAKLETQQSDFGYRGAFRPGSEYRPGNFVTLSGALWHCQQPTRSRPGADSTWRLCVKNGTFTRY